MKSIFAITALAFSLSICGLADRLANGNRSEAGTESSNSQTTNKSNVNGSSNEPVTPPPPPLANGSATKSGSAGAVSGGDLKDKATSLPKPAYPPAARAVKASGAVVVEVDVDETGKVTSASAVSGHPLLRQSAVQAAYQARFSPAMLSGKPVKVTGTITYNFEL